MATYGVTGAHLRLRWASGEKSDEWVCHYELVIPLRDTDIRREDNNRDHNIIPMGLGTRRHSKTTPCSSNPLDSPYRDGSHAVWDSAALGNIPIYVISPTGTATPIPGKQ